MRDWASDHFDGERFFNPGVNTDRSREEFRRWRRTRKPVPWPKQAENPVFPPLPTVAASDEILATYIGQACFLLQCGGINLLTDPMFSERASPLSWAGPRRVRPPGVALADLPEIHFVLLSHNHYDHMDLPSLRQLQRRSKPMIVTGLGNGRYLERKGIGPSTELDWWQSCTPCRALRITYVPAQHWSARGLFDRRRVLWGGHVVETAAGRIYFAGDTGYPAQFCAIRDRLGPPDVALLPIGAYEPRWFMGPQHRNPDDAVMAHRDLGAGTSLAMHFATFPLTDEAMEAPVQALDEVLRQHGVLPEAFRVPGFGEPLRFEAQASKG